MTNLLSSDSANGLSPLLIQIGTVALDGPVGVNLQSPVADALQLSLKLLDRHVSCVWFL